MGQQKDRDKEHHHKEHQKDRHKDHHKEHHKDHHKDKHKDHHDRHGHKEHFTPEPKQGQRCVFQSSSQRSSNMPGMNATPQSLPIVSRSPEKYASNATATSSNNNATMRPEELATALRSALRPRLTSSGNISMISSEMYAPQRNGPAPVKTIRKDPGDLCNEVKATLSAHDTFVRKVTHEDGLNPGSNQLDIGYSLKDELRCCRSIPVKTGKVEVQQEQICRKHLHFHKDCADDPIYRVKVESTRAPIEEIGRKEKYRGIMGKLMVPDYTQEDTTADLVSRPPRFPKQTPPIIAYCDDHMAHPPGAHKVPHWF